MCTYDIKMCYDMNFLFVKEAKKKGKKLKRKNYSWRKKVLIASFLRKSQTAYGREA
jgi:hypothetical protein